MKVALAQIKSTESVSKNVEIHEKWIQEASDKAVDLLVFPELSLTSYAPSIAVNLEPSVEEGIRKLQTAVDKTGLTVIAGGVSPSHGCGIELCISSFLLQGGKKVSSYQKICLSQEEQDYFAAGKTPLAFELEGKRVALGICYEGSLKEHFELYSQENIDLYLVSACKDDDALQRAQKNMLEVAKRHEIHCALVNAIGPVQGFNACGSSFHINPDQSIESLEEKEGLLVLEMA